MFGQRLARRRSLLWVALIFGVHAITHVGAQEMFPSRAIKLIVPATAGGATDVITRALAEKMSSSMGQQVVVENKVGANGIVAVRAAASAPPDGYTLLLIHTAYSQNLALRTDQPYKLADLVPLVMIGRSGMVLAVPASVRANTVKEFLDHARDSSEKLSYGSSGVASTGHFYGEMLNSTGRLGMTHVPYPGEVAVLNDLLAGRLNAAWGAAGFFEPHVKAGKLKMLAITGPSRMAQYPQIPSFVELGYPAFDLAGWNGVFTTRGTPQAVVDRLIVEITKGLHTPDVVAKLNNLGFVAVGTQGPAFEKFIDEDVRKWSAAAAANNIKPQ